jgi:hypothetical protein
VSPKANGQDWHPVEVPYIEAAYGDGSSRRVAREAVIIAKRDWLPSEIVGAANDAHGDSANRKTLPQLPRLENPDRVLMPGMQRLQLGLSHRLGRNFHIY